MMRLELARLWAEGAIEGEISVELEDPLWVGMEMHPTSPLVGKIRAVRTTSGDILVTGGLSVELAGECRRCLSRVHAVVAEDVRILFSAREGVAGEGGDGTVRLLDTGARMLDLSEALREEVALAVPAYRVCKEDCRGLCAQCGANMNHEECDCAQTGDDPRWAPLRALKNK